MKNGARHRHAVPLCLAFLVLSIFFAGPLAAQTSLEAEIRNLEEKVRLSSSAAARLEDLGRLAGLRELSGDIEGAAAAWELAAGGGRNTQALLRGAACFMSLGEWERADAALKGILLNSGAGEERFHANFLRAQMEGLRSGGAETSALVSLLEDPAYRGYGPRICFSLWKFTGRESWRKKLAGDFPRSPEGRIAAGGDAAAVAVLAEPSPLWLLFAAAPRPAQPTIAAQPVNAGPPAAQPTAAGPVNAGPPAAQPTAAGPAAPQPTVAQPAAPSAAQPLNAQPAQSPAPRRPGETLLQAGLFSREANALVLLEKLRAAGFPALMERQPRAGGDYTAVYVRPGPDVNRSIRDLKAAGFDSFPVAP